MLSNSAISNAHAHSEDGIGSLHYTAQNFGKITMIRFEIGRESSIEALGTIGTRNQRFHTNYFVFHPPGADLTDGRCLAQKAPHVPKKL